MSSKEVILAKIRKNTGQKYDFPTWKINTLKYPDTLLQFIKASAITGVRLCCWKKDRMSMNL